MLLMGIQALALQANTDRFSADTFSLLCFESLRSLPSARLGFAFDFFKKFPLVAFRKLFFSSLPTPVLKVAKFIESSDCSLNPSTVLLAQASDFSFGSILVVEFDSFES